MNLEAFYLLPLCSAVLYPIGSLFLKQALAEGAGALRTIFLSNLGIALCFLPLLPFTDAPPVWSEVAWPILTGVVFFLGQVFTILALKVGDVSVQAPLMGTKTVFVALASIFFLPEGIPSAWWWAAGITALAVFLLGNSEHTTFHHAAACVCFSLLSAAFYGLTDVLVQTRSGAFSRIPFALVMTSTTALLSCGIIPLFNAPLNQLPRSARAALCWGSLAIGVQALLLNIALAFFGRATAMNVLYSSRGLWGIILVWFAGHLFANRERESVPRAIMAKRLLGALLLCLAIVLVLA